MRTSNRPIQSNTHLWRRAQTLRWKELEYLVPYTLTLPLPLPLPLPLLLCLNPTHTLRKMIPIFQGATMKTIGMSTLIDQSRRPTSSCIPHNRYTRLSDYTSFSSIDKFLVAAGNSEQFDGNESVDKALEKLNLRDLYTPLPGMQVALMPHQVIGVAWMLEKERSAMKGGALADEMGLGKVSSVCHKTSAYSQVVNTLIHLDGANVN